MWKLAVLAVFVVTACATETASRRTVLPRRALDESLSLMTGCYRGVNPERVEDFTHTDFYCSQIYRRPACGKAWHDMSMAFTTPRMPDDVFNARSYVAAVVDACRADYCIAEKHPTTLPSPALCAAKTELTKDTIIEFVTWLLDQELTFPIEQSQKWARGAFVEGIWLRTE